MNVDPAFWQQFVAQKPALRRDLEWQSQHYRGESWMLLKEPLHGNFYRCPASVADFLRALDGHTTITAALAALPNEEQPEQEALLRLITELSERQLLVQGLDENLQQRMKQRVSEQKRQSRQRWLMPLSIRIPLWNPDTFLQRFGALWPGLFCPLAGWLALVLLLMAGWLAQNQAGPLQAHFESRFLDPANLLWFWLLYPPIKFLHEMAHATAVSRWGGRVHELGIMLLVFLPVPYVDATASYGFSHKRQRMLVAAAGILLELVCAALAMVLWWQAEPGLWRDLCFNVMVIAGVSTLLINGNPLLKFDGYHVLAEALEMPNLAARSQRVVRAQWAGLLLGSDKALPTNEAAEVHRICLVYGYAAAAYRLLIACGIIWLVAGQAFVLGLVLALWYLLQQWCWPAVKALVFLWQNALVLGQKASLLLRGGAMLGAVCLLLFWPWQSSTSFEAVASLPEKAAVRAASPGTIEQVLVQAGEAVSPGQPLFVLHNTELDTQAAVLQARIQEVNQRRQALSLRDEVARQILQNELQTLQQEANDLEARREALIIVSQVAGLYQPRDADALEGRYVRQGEVLAYLFSPEGITLSAVVSQALMPRLQRGNSHRDDLPGGRFAARFAMQPERVYGLQLEQEVPAMTRQLPGAILGSDVQRDARDITGKTATEAVYHLRFSVPDYNLPVLAGQARIRVEHDGYSMFSRMQGGLWRLWWQHQARSEG